VLEYYAYATGLSKFMIIALSVLIIIRCFRSMLNDKYEPETWAYIKVDGETLPVLHWENILGRSRSADVRIRLPGVRRVHAVLKRNENGLWAIYDVFSRGEVWVNKYPVDGKGIILEDGATIKLGEAKIKFKDIDTKKRQRLEEHRTFAGNNVSPSLTLAELTVLQLFLVLAHTFTIADEYTLALLLSFSVLIVLEWVFFNITRVFGRSGFEVEVLAFYLTTLGLSVCVSSTPEDIYKQTLLIVGSVAAYFFFGLWLRGTGRTEHTRMPMAVLALALLAVNIAAGEVVNGARNWLQIGGYSIQPSELIKVAYVYVGAASLDRLYRNRNLISFILFSALCVCALALIGDFGTALVFFICFLVISFMRSGSIATVVLAITGAGLAGFLAMSVKPYIAQRFSMWGHVWEDPYNYGYQQTRALSASAAGGLFGKGAGSGWLGSVFAGNADMVFAMVAEELGLIVAFCSVLAILALAFFTVRASQRGRSAFYSIAACASVTILLAQLALNVFGSLDLLPFTGVTFPFVSKGGTSLLSCWLLMAFLKGNDTRRGGSFVVKPVREITVTDDFSDYEEYEEDR